MKAEEKKMRTLDDIRACTKTMLSPQDVSLFLGCDHYSINLQAKRNPAALGFPVIMIGSRVRIPRDGFVAFCEGAGLGS